MSALEIVSVGLTAAFLIGGILVFFLAAFKLNKRLDQEDEIDE